MKMPDHDRMFTTSAVDEQIDALTGVQNEQTLSSSVNARMLHDLYQVYDHASYSRRLEQSLECIGQRLEEKRTQRVEAEKLKKQHVPPLKVTTAPIQTRSHSQGKAKRAAESPIVSRLASLAAVFFVALLVGSLLLTLLATRRHASDIGGNQVPQVIAVHMGPASFLVSSVILHPGMSVQLVNDNPVVHIIKNGYWKDGTLPVPVLIHEQGMPKSPINFEALHETHLIGPFQTSGSYHLFDAIHVAMNLTIQVRLSSTPGGVTPTPAKNAVRVYLDQGTFRPRTITIDKDMSILLTNDILQETHIIVNGYWNGNDAVYVVPRGKPVPHQVQLDLQNNPGAKLDYIDGQGVPIVDVVVQPGNAQLLIGPFMMAGTYSLFDTVHVGMNLTVVVQ